VGLNTWIREPLSGTYNTMESNIVDVDDIQGQFGQGLNRVTGTEANINPANSSPCLGNQTATGCPAGDIPSANPYEVTNVAGGTIGRVLGTGDMVKMVKSVSDSLGYAFWSFGTFNGYNTTEKYLTVDGVDPLFSTVNTNPNGTGALPQCATIPCTLPLDNIKNGSYPIWSKYRGVWGPTSGQVGADVTPNIIANAQTVSVVLLTDMIPADAGSYGSTSWPALQTFHSHFGQVVSTSGTGWYGNNGYKTGIPETGGDMGGQVLTVQSELDILVDTGGAQQTERHQ
jgi:hypothetical protein